MPVAPSFLAAPVALVVVVIAFAILLRVWRNRKLSSLQGAPARSQQLLQTGTFVIQFPEGDITVEEQFLPLFRNTQLDQDTFRSYIHPDDREKFESMLKEIEISNIVYSWVDIRIGTPAAGFRKYHIYGNIERHVSGPAETFDGMIQDITDTP